MWAMNLRNESGDFEIVATWTNYPTEEQQRTTAFEACPHDCIPRDGTGVGWEIIDLPEPEEGLIPDSCAPPSDPLSARQWWGTSAPGESILEWMIEDFAERTGIEKYRMQRIVEGRCAIQLDDAERISLVVGTPAEFWLKREKTYSEGRLK